MLYPLHLVAKHASSFWLVHVVPIPTDAPAVFEAPTAYLNHSSIWRAVAPVERETVNSDKTIFDAVEYLKFVPTARIIRPRLSEVKSMVLPLVSSLDLKYNYHDNYLA